jgi:four helix bundle protein
MSEAPINSYQDLRVWQDSMSLVEDAYRAAKEFPKEELYGITSQIRRAAVSVPANIAEGYGRESAGSYAHHLKIAQGSLKELETLFLLSERVGVSEAGANTQILARCTQVGKMLNGLIRSIERTRTAD